MDGLTWSQVYTKALILSPLANRRGRRQLQAAANADSQSSKTLTGSAACCLTTIIVSTLILVLRSKKSTSFGSILNASISAGIIAALSEGFGGSEFVNNLDDDFTIPVGMIIGLRVFTRLPQMLQSD